MAAMPWPIRSTPRKFDGFTNFLGSADFAGVNEPVQS